MAVGIEVLNDTGSVIIDQNYLSMGFLAKGSTTLNQEFGWSGASPTFTDAWKASPDVFTPGMLIAFRARDSARPVGVLAGGFGSTQFVGQSFTSTAPIVDWWAFGRPSVAANLGVEVYDSTGLLTFTSNAKPMKIVAAANDQEFMNTGSINVATAGDYAICIGNPMPGVVSGSETSSGGMFQWLEGRIAYGAATSTGFNHPTYVTTARKESGTYPTGVRMNNIRGSILLVDVAGL